MDALDDVAAFAERAKDALGFLRQNPLARADGRREAELFQLAGARSQHRSFDIVRLISIGPKVDQADLASRLPAPAPDRAESNGRPQPAVRAIGESPARCGSRAPG